MVNLEQLLILNTVYFVFILVKVNNLFNLPGKLR